MGFEIRTISNLVHRKLNEMVMEEEETLTIRQNWVLNFLLESKTEDLVQRDIEKRFSIRRSTASHMLQLMEKNGYIRRMEVPHDARMKKIVITEKGRAACERMRNRLERFETMFQAGLSQEELEEFLRILDHLEKNLL